MKVFVLTREDVGGEFDFKQFLRRLTDLGINYQFIDADSKEAVSYLELYNITDFPAIIITKDDGSLIELWQKDFPSPENISHFYHQ